MQNRFYLSEGIVEWRQEERNLFMLAMIND